MNTIDHLAHREHQEHDHPAPVPSPKFTGKESEVCDTKNKRIKLESSEILVPTLVEKWEGKSTFGFLKILEHQQDSPN